MLSSVPRGKEIAEWRCVLSVAYLKADSIEAGQDYVLASHVA